jgi:FkbH-like protein
MRVTDALKILHGAPKGAKPFEVSLACGFTPLHLQTFLSAHLQEMLPDRHVIASTGLYGNLAGTIEESTTRAVSNIVIALEWADLDPRLGHRSAASWNSGTILDVLRFVPRTLERLGQVVERAARNAKVVISLPTLPFPPLFPKSTWQMSESEAVLHKDIAEFAAQITSIGIPLVNASSLAEESATGLRYDLKSDLLLGLPYTQEHADKLAQCLARLLCPPIAKKGIITDLDDTLWSGLIGEVGAEGVRWDLDGHGGLHALYQNLLASLVESGVLIGVASKNELTTVEKGFERADLILKREKIYPMEVHWQAKSTSVERILRAWNVSADSVVFVDDSSMELAEVVAAHPQMECIQFPKKDYAAGLAMLRHLRDIFGKQKVSEEDSFRLESIRQSGQFQRAVVESDPENFLQEAQAVVRFDSEIGAKDSRALELVNKTNQFNLNGIRYTESDWAAAISRPNARLVVTSYEDRFGQLGKIAVILGTLEDSSFRIRTWVMSCRAFSRRIEYMNLKNCFEAYRVHQIEFDFLATDRNKPLQEFLRNTLDENPAGKATLTRDRFEQVCPALYHKEDHPRSRPANG